MDFYSLSRANTAEHRQLHNWVDSRGQNIRWKVSDVWRDFPACEKLSHLVAEYVAVVLEEAVFVAAVQQENIDRG